MVTIEKYLAEMLRVDSVYSECANDIVVYIQHFETNYFCHASAMKDFERMQFIAIQNLCSQESVCATSLGFVGEVGVKSPLQLSLRTY